MAVMYKHWSLVPKNEWQWGRFFKPQEIASHGDGSLLIDVDALDKLYALRAFVDRPLVILSAYRDPIHNARVGGAPLSQHKFGRAFDVKLTMEQHKLIAAAKAVGFRGIGMYKTFVHVDTGPSRVWSG